jgi:hypothetical protein
VKDRNYDIALRPDDEGLLDDVVVRGVEMFRMERLTDHQWFVCCYLTNGERITFHPRVPGKRPRRAIDMYVGEWPEGVRYEEGSMEPPRGLR